MSVPGQAGKIVQFQAHGNAIAVTDGEQRIAARRRMLKAGVVAYNDRHATLACSVRDMSTTGARLRIEGSISAPDTFELLVALDGLEASCEVVWRNGNEVGVRFVAAPRIVAPKRSQTIDPLVAPGKASLRRKRPSDPV